MEGMEKLSKAEKKNIAWHLVLSLSLLFVIGVVTLALGLLYNKMMLFAIGITITIVVCVVFLAASLIQHKKYLDELKAPYLENLKIIEDKLTTANEVAASIEEEFPNIMRTDLQTLTLKWSKSGFVSYLSLVRLIEALTERISEAGSLINSFSTNSVIKGIELLEAPLTFETRSYEHLIDHQMPEMPSATWLNSLKSLTEQVKSEKSKLKSKSPLYSL